MSHNAKIVAIVVTYKPDLEVLGRLVDHCLPQVDNIVFVDNGDDERLPAWLRQKQNEKLKLIPLGKNLGIAAAQNIGVDWARQNEANYVLMLDHDSVPAQDMVMRLLDVSQTKNAAGEKIAAVGPRFYDERRDVPLPFIRIEGLRLHRRVCGPGLPPVVPVDYLISSGSLISLTTLGAVGGMEERLFIDYVDIEWGLRAKRAGYQCYGVYDALMEHSLGDQPLRFLRWQLPVHSPLRHYYMARNSLWLCRQGWIPANWKFVEGTRLILRIAGYSVLAHPRGKHITMMLKGLWHGLRGRMGPY